MPIPAPALEEPKLQDAQEWTEQHAKESETGEWPIDKGLPTIWRGVATSSINFETRIRKQLQAEVSRQRLLEMEDGWDGEGSPSYSEDTVDRAIEFVVAQARRVSDFGLSIPTPHIGPGPDGSIDLHWKQSSRELLVNIPADVHKVATFYGDDYKSQKIKGSGEIWKSRLGNRRVADEIVWPIEPIPDCDSVFMRAHSQHFSRSGELQPGVFRPHGGGMSVNWGKYASAEETRQQATRAPDENAVIKLPVSGIRQVDPLRVEHTPTGNRAHTDVNGIPDGGEDLVEVRVLLRRVANVVIPPRDKG